MMMSLCLVQDYRLELDLEITGGLTGKDSVFPEVEAWLGEDGDRVHAFKRIQGRKSARGYRSMMDFLLCEVCPEERAGCHAFYRAKGPQLRFLRSEKEIRLLESKLLVFLAIAYEAHCQARRVTWGQAVEMVAEICAAA
jgi:hypothetical protein